MTIDEFYDLMQRLRIRHNRTNNHLFLDHKDNTGGNILAANISFERTVGKDTIVKRVHFHNRAVEMEEVRMHCLLHGIEVSGHVYTRDPNYLEEELYARGRYRDSRANTHTTVRR